MIEIAQMRAARDGIQATFRVHDLSAPLFFANASLGGVLAVLGGMNHGPGAEPAQETAHGTSRRGEEPGSKALP